MKIIKKIISFTLAAVTSASTFGAIAVSAFEILTFSEFSGTNVVTATGEQTVPYEGMEIHLNTNDTVTGAGILWNAPGTTTYDSTVVSNNRYIKYVPEKNGELSITFRGDSVGSKGKKPRMYIVAGEDESSMNKVNGDKGGQIDVPAINTDTVLKYDVIAGNTYYIWPHCEKGPDVKFKVSKVSFTEKNIAPVSSLKVIYKCNNAEVKSYVLDVNGLFEGASYTYKSSAYIKGTDGKIYAVGEDFKDDTLNKVLNSSSGGINSAIKQEVTLKANTEIIYNVKETDVAFYDEWENLLNSEAAEFNSDRYWASEGKMTQTSKVQEFYEVLESGYYQILIVGGAQNNGTEIFPNKAVADAAAQYGQGTALIGIKYSRNQYYGVYSSATVFLNKGDNLAIKGFGDGNTTDKLDYIAMRKINDAAVNGADGVSAGTSARFEFISSIKEKPEWSVTGADGVSIDNNGTLIVSENAAEGTAVVTASLRNGAVTASKNVQIAKPQIVSADIDGTAAINIGDTKEYKAINVKDQFGNEITAYSSAVYSSDNNNIVTVDETGVANAVSKGNADITAVITVGEASKTVKKNVKSDNYSIIADANGELTNVDISDIVQSDNITGYTVTTADEDGNKIKQYTIEGTTDGDTAAEDAVVIYAEYLESGALKDVDVVEVKTGERVLERSGRKMFVWNSLNGMKPAKLIKTQGTADIIMVNSKNAAKIEISPIYTYEYATPDTNDDMLLSDAFADGDYSFEITKAPKNQYGCIYDLYVNDAMIGNNVNEKGIGREFTKGDELIYAAKDITVDGGSITVQKREFYTFSGSLRVKDEDKGVSKIVVRKEPTISNRNKKVYILGDSLVAKYYGEPADYTAKGLVGTARTGWGQLIDNFFNEDIEVLNLANSGQWAKGLQETAFSCVMQSARQGDYMILESGWNDKSKSNAAEMKQAVIEMVEECEKKGVIPVLVTPNSSSSTFKAGADTQLAPTMREAANEMMKKYDDVIFVDLAALSNKFLSDTYGTDTDAMNANINLGNAGSSSLTGEHGDGLHLSYLGAMKYAELVAQSMADGGVNFINKDFSWSVQDKAGNMISVQIK